MDSGSRTGDKASLWSRQPFKAVCIVSFLLVTPAHLALLLVRCLAWPLRPRTDWPRTDWTVRQNVAVAFARSFFQLVTTSRPHRPLSIDPIQAKKRLSRVAPPPDDLFGGVLDGARHRAVRPAPVNALWYPGPAPRDAAELDRQRVVLHFPGGAFVVGFPPEIIGQAVADTMAGQMRAARTVWAQYRLARSPESRFPAALQDVVTFYHHVLSLGVDPSNVVLSGDSAGGNLVFALLRYLESTPTPPLPLPGGAVIHSPWVHVTAHAGRDFEQSRNSRSDLIVGPLLQWGASSYLPPGEVLDDVAPYVSPLHHPFKLSTPLFVCAGEAEGFHDDIKCFADEMAAVEGNRVRFRAMRRAPHDLLLAHKLFGMMDQVKAVIKKACDFLERGHGSSPLPKG